jgi:uncharacterized protein (DUF488 family)
MKKHWKIKAARKIMLLYTIGHSNRDFDAFADILGHHGIEAIADVRSSPGSKRFPQFNRSHLEQRLPEMGVRYAWFRDLGGFKRVKGQDGSELRGLEGYRAYMGQPAFRAAAMELLELAGQRRTAIMCAEKDPAKCHRHLLAEYLEELGHEVVHV